MRISVYNDETPTFNWQPAAKERQKFAPSSRRVSSVAICSFVNGLRFFFLGGGASACYWLLAFLG